VIRLGLRNSRKKRKTRKPKDNERQKEATMPTYRERKKQIQEGQHEDTACDEDGVDVRVGVDVDAVVGVGVHGQGVNLGVGLGVGLVVGSPLITSLDS